MPPVKRLQQKPRTKSTDNSRAVEQRKERSRDAARSRRGKENAQFDELAKLLPLPSAITSQLDKASIVRLTISYLNMKQFNIHKQSKGYGNRSSDSFLSESSTSPPSDADVDVLFGSPGIPSPGSSSPSPTVIPGNSAGAVVSYNPAEISLQDLSDNSGIFLLQALDGFVFVLSNEGKVLYVSETVSNHLGLSQVELTGSNISSYIHPEDQDDLFGLLEIARQEAENPNDQAATGAYTDNIRFFGQQPFDNNDDLPDKEKPKSFFMRMKCTLVRRGGSYTKSSGFKVIHCMGRMKRYEAKGLPEVKFAFVAIGQPLPTMNINELPLECNMFVSRVNMDLKIVYCEGRIHKFTDYFARDIVGISAYDFYHANDIGIIQGHHAKFLSKGQVLTKYYRWMNKNGGWVWLQTKASLIPHPSNPELKQMLCLNYIVSEVEHRGVVLGMAQLEDKPQLHSRAYITEVDNDTDETGELKDAQFDDQVMVYPKWHENSDKLVPKPTLMDTLALSRTGYTKVSGLENPSLSDEVFTTMAETLSKAPAVTSWSKRCSSKADDGSTSTLEDDFEDLTEIINSELTKLDREIVNFVANGSTDVSATSQMPDANIENVLSGNWLVSTTSNGSIPSGNMLQAPKMEPISLEDAVNFNEQNSQPMSTPSQTIGNLPVGSYPDDVKPNLIPLNGESMFQLPSSKRRGINSPCMFNSATSTSVRNFQPNGPIQGQINNTPNLHVVGALQQMPNVRNSNSLSAPVVPVRNAPYASNQPVNMSELGPVQGSSIASTPVPLNPQMASPKEPQLQLAQLLKEALPDNATFTDQMVVDLVDEMMVDQEGETQRRKDDQKLASLLQQGGFVQPEVIIKQEVVTPTMSQPTFGFPTVSNTVASLQCQLSMPPNAFTSTNNVNGGEAMFVGSPQGPQNGTVTNQFTEATHEAMKLLVAAAFVALVAPLQAIKASRGIHPNLAPLFNVRTDFARTDLDKFKGVAAKLDNVTNQIVLVNEVKVGPSGPSGHAAWAHLADRLNETGWMELHVSTPHEAFFSNDVKMYSAGLLEGLLSAERMSQFYSNFYPLLQPDEDSSRALLNIRNLFNLQVQHVMHHCGLSGGLGEEPEDPYWKQVRYLFLQMWGLKDAYNVVAQEKGVSTIDMVDMFFINSHAELGEMMQAYSPEATAARAGELSQGKKKVFLQMDLKEESQRKGENSIPVEVDRDEKLRLAKRGHCSALVRLAPSNGELLVGHTTWSDYSKMTRVFKYYNFHLPLSFQSSHLIALSSYPGCVSSTDDFYMLDSGLTVMDTTLEVLNPRVYDRISEDPHRPRLPRFLHVMAVNRVAKTGTQWTSMLSSESLGTGNSQWLVVDYNRFTPGQPLRDGALRLLEQLPGISHQADLTSELSAKGYWGSFNRPFFQDIRQMSGHEQAEARWGSFYSFEAAPRAEMLQRYGAGVGDLSGMRDAMTKNNPKETVVGQPSGPGHAIMARLDLDAMVNNIPNGGIDAKVTNSCLLKKMKCQAISGPSHQMLPAFRWTSEAENGLSLTQFLGIKGRAGPTWDSPMSGTLTSSRCLRRRRNWRPRNSASADTL